MNSRSLKITISNPCSQLWDEMKVSETGRFCDSCRKSVIDFSGQSDHQIKEYVKQHASEEICGRFYKHQVDRIRIEFDENILQSDLKFWQKYLVVLLVCFGSEVMGIDFCLAQDEVQDTAVVAVDTVAATEIIDTVTLSIPDTNLEGFRPYTIGKAICRIENFPSITMGVMRIETPEIEDPTFNPESIIELFENRTTVDSNSVKNPGIKLNTQTKKPKDEEEDKNQDLRKLVVLSPFVKARKRRKKANSTK